MKFPLVSVTDPGILAVPALRVNVVVLTVELSNWFAKCGSN